MPSSPVEFLKIEDWTDASYDGIIWTHKKIDEMNICLAEIRLLLAESLATPGLQRPPRWRELDENVFKFGMLHDAIVDMLTAAFDALNACWENNDEDYAYKYMEAKPLRRRFEKTSDAFHAEKAEFEKKAYEKVEKHLAAFSLSNLARRLIDKDSAAQQEHVTGDDPTSSAATVQFTCDVCTKTFGSLQGLNDHKKDAHGVPVKPPANASKHVTDEYHRQLGIYCQQQMDKLQKK